MNLSEFDVFSTKQSNYFPNDELSPSMLLCEKHFKLPIYPIKTSVLKNNNSHPNSQQKRSSFKDEIKVSFTQQRKNIGDTQQIDPITIRDANFSLNNTTNKTTTKTLDLALNSIEFSKPYPLPTLNTLEREIKTEIEIDAQREVTDSKSEKYNERLNFNKNRDDPNVNKTTDMLEYTSSKGNFP